MFNFKKDYQSDSQAKHRSDVHFRIYLLDASVNDAASLGQINKMSDADLSKYSNMVNQVGAYFTDAVLKSADSSWTFNQDMTLVRIRTSATLDDGQKWTVYIDMENVNGKWY